MGHKRSLVCAVQKRNFPKKPCNWEQGYNREDNSREDAVGYLNRIVPWLEVQGKYMKCSRCRTMERGRVEQKETNHPTPPSLTSLFAGFVANPTPLVVKPSVASKCRHPRVPGFNICRDRIHDFPLWHKHLNLIQLRNILIKGWPPQQQPRLAKPDTFPLCWVALQPLQIDSFSISGSFGHPN